MTVYPLMSRYSNQLSITGRGESKRMATLKDMPKSLICRSGIKT